MVFCMISSSQQVSVFCFTIRNRVSSNIFIIFVRDTSIFSLFSSASCLIWAVA